MTIRNSSSLRFRICGLVMAVTALADPASAQSTAVAAIDPGLPAPPAVVGHDPAGRVVVRATRINQPLTIDGKLDEALYGEVQAITEFIQQDPQPGEPVTEKTEMWVLFDDRNVYIACRCWDRNPEGIIANDMRRDGQTIVDNDHIAVALDTFHDLRNGNLFYVTPVGGMRDTAATDERQNNADWNTVWAARAGRFDGGWIAEMAIPFKSLRYKPGREQIWGINLRRALRARNEYAYLTKVEPSWGTPAIFRFSAAGTLVGLEAPPGSKNLEIKPYAISSVTTDLVSNPQLKNDFGRDVGFDVKYGLTKNLTADFTYNTDFAQVEADEAQINLTRFNLSFPEKREFFLEGGGLFNFGTIGTGGGAVPGGSGNPGGGDAPTMFYSRSIGIKSGRALPILGGARLTGRIGRWGIGALNIESDEAPAANALQTNFTVMRLRRDVLRRSAVGLLFTRKSISTVAPGSNELYGMDGSFGFYQNVYLSGYVARTQTEGLGGKDLSYRTQFNYAGDRFGVQMDRLVVPENFNPEVGFLRRRNFRRNFAMARFSPRPAQNRIVRRYFYETAFEYTTDNNNRLETREGRAAFRIEFQNSNGFHLEYFRQYEFLALPFEIADNIWISIGGHNFQNVRTSFFSGQQNRFSGVMAMEMGSFYTGTKKTAVVDGRVTLTDRLAVEPSISLNWIDLPEGDFTTTLLGSRTTFTVTPWMFVGALVQYASATSSLSTNVRFRWEYQPGSELFLVYTEGRDTLPPGSRTELANRGFVVKINRLIRF